MVQSEIEPPNYVLNLEKFGSNIAISSEKNGEISYEQLHEYVKLVTVCLTKRALVFCFCRNNAETIVGYLGILNSQCVSIMINGNISIELLEQLNKRYSPEYIWVEKSRIIEFRAPTKVYEFGDYVLLRTQNDFQDDLHPELSLLLPTSGSTGSPKYVRLSHGNLSSNAKSIAKYLDIQSEEKTITTLPSSYSYGLSIINSHLLKGATIHLTEYSLMEKRFWEILGHNDIDSFGGVPYTYKMLDKIKVAETLPQSLRTLTQAGGKLGKKLSLKFAKICQGTGRNFIVMYGQTEATARMSYLPPKYAINKAGSIGIPIPGGEFWLVNESGKVIEDSDVSGELFYSGLNVSLGYAEFRSDLKNGDENNGVLATGDLALRDKDGFYYIVGRIKRFLKIFGNRINLDEIENQLNQTGYEVVCTGSDDQLLIFTTDKNKLQEITRYVKKNFHIHSTALKISYIESIPRNSSGKIQYSRLNN